ncbi:kinase-like domain-containing protein [Flagelloscypha sp. PMI_526]|nr:kinase-like domain-containing protein [Flagelloscypha sp. PMI_526]
MSIGRYEQVKHLRQRLASNPSISSSLPIFERLLPVLEAQNSTNSACQWMAVHDCDLRNLVLKALDIVFLAGLNVFLPPQFALYFSCNKNDNSVVETVVILTPTAGAAFDVRSPSLPMRIPTDLDAVACAIDGAENTFAPIFAEKEPCIISCAMELVQWEMDSSSNIGRKAYCLRWLRKLARVQGRLPLSFYLSNLQNEPEQVGGGGFSDVFVGKLGSQRVCLKVLRIYQGKGHKERVIKEFCKEALIWRQLKHSNVLPFLGVTETLFPRNFCLVSPFMNNGNVMSFLEVNPTHNRLSFVWDIASGIDYLHSFSPPVIHGDVRGANILVQDNLSCCLADFGLALVSDSQLPTTSSNTALKGCPRWGAPEVFFPEMFQNAAKEKRDVYAFACTIIEMHTGKPPFAEIPTDFRVMLEIQQGRRPLQPPHHLLTSDLWNLVNRCWSQEPSERLSMGENETAPFLECSNAFEVSRQS